MSAAVLLGTLGFAVTGHADSVHTVMPGESLIMIAAANGTTVANLADNNKIENINFILVGQKIIVDGVSQPSKKTQTVQSPVAKHQAPVQKKTPVTSYASSSSKAWIANRESRGSYTVTNGRYIGKYQMDASRLHGDYSPANQERAADRYVAQRYGSWDNAKAHWLSAGWY